MFNSLKKFGLMLIREPEANSRFVFLIHGIAGAIGMLMAGVAFLLPHFGSKDLVADVIMAYGAVTGISAGGRYLTKKGDGEQGK